MLALVAALEAANPLPEPLRCMERVAGDWRLLYTTTAITVRPSLIWNERKEGAHADVGGALA